jgi:hypothetical protein
VARQLVAICLLLLGVMLVTLACGSPSDQAAPGSPAAQATNVRRTAVARVQGIIANKSTPTAVPQPTATPTPSCQNAIWWTEAKSHLGESRTIQGTVVGWQPLANGSIMLELGQPYPDPTGLSVLIGTADATTLSGKDVCVSGRIGLTEGQATLQVQDPTTLRVVD